VPLELRRDRHFLFSREDFEAHAEGRKVLLLEFFYREMRRKTGYLMEGKNPLGGRWNYDAENQKTFPATGPGTLPEPLSFPPDSVTREVIALVERRFAEHPGSLAYFDWPVTPEDARKALKDFVRRRLRDFGPYEDAMWRGQPFLYHSRLSSSLNLKLLDPRDALRDAESALRRGRAPLNSVEGFVRQILGWREYVRGIYWLEMPEYASRNALNARSPLPGFYWTGDTDMNCLRECIKQTLHYGFAHHIQRLMVTGLFALLLGVDPKEVHKWYLAIYVDAVEWVELPNTLGMSQYGDGGIMASKPYAASGKYIKRMSNYCDYCRYDPSRDVGEKACPFTTLYWDFLVRNERTLAANMRIQLQMKNVRRLDRERIKNVKKQADRIRAKCTS
jgi:deoxyribodipyrimidine photolyase-related protein